ncbi:MAG: replication factor C large subunit [Candidatus Anstonellales archaeon]
MLTEKYRPKILKDIVGNEEAKKQAIEWIEKVLKGKEKKALFIYGSTGVGKTSLAYAIAKEYNLEPIFLTTSEKRNDITIKSMELSNAFSVFGKRRLIIFDDLEGLASKDDRGAINAIVHIIKEAKNPIILIANDYWNQKLKQLRPFSIPVQMKKLNAMQIKKILEYIVKKENIKNVNIDEIAKYADGDVRASINNLESNMAAYRDKKRGAYDVILSILKGKNIDWARKTLMQSDDDPELIIAWLDENIAVEYKTKEEIAKAYDYLSKSDLFRARITKRQYWGFLRYVTVFLAFIALAKKHESHGLTRYAFPSYIKELSATMEKRAKIKSIAGKIAKKIHSNIRYVINNFQFYKMLILKNKEMAKNYFMLNDDEIEFLGG